MTFPQACEIVSAYRDYKIRLELSKGKWTGYIYKNPHEAVLRYFHAAVFNTGQYTLVLPTKAHDALTFLLNNRNKQNFIAWCNLQQ
jgi:hypothetical protein